MSDFTINLDELLNLPLVQRIDYLLSIARPGGEASVRLRKYRDQASRNVLLGPGVMSYINGLLRKVMESIECRHLTQLGKCRKKNLACGYVDNNKACMLYEANRPLTRGDPLGR